MNLDYEIRKLLVETHNGLSNENRDNLDRSLRESGKYDSYYRCLEKARKFLKTKGYIQKF